jgi:thiol-disulfide isomerase/thioredoxin
VRIGVGVGLLAVCLGLTGCSLFGKKNSQAGGGGAPFLGARAEAPAAAPAAPAAAPVTPTSATSGILAGQVLDPLNRRAGGVPIQIVDLDDGNKSAPKARLDYEATNEGFFLISGLTPGHHYQLIARTKDGTKVLSGTVFATPPNPRLSIYLQEDLAAPDAPKSAGAPGKPDGGKETKPAASLDPPVKAAPGQPSAGNAAVPPGPAATAIPADPSRIARENNGAYAQAPVGNINSPVIPPAPGSERRDPPGSPIVPAPASDTGPGAALPNVQAPVPFCVLQGRRLGNFALKDLDGQTWEYNRNRKGRVVLLDFWYSTCPHCLPAMPKLAKLQQEYGSYGLEVVGIAYEKGDFDRQAMNVRGVRARLGANYTMLLGGGGTGPCPVRTQFGVSRFPTLVLLDASGNIIMQKEGLDERGEYELVMEIRRQLGIR